jgi:hypothetical protein
LFTYLLIFLVYSDIYQYLESKCLGGNRAEAKYAVAVLSSLVQPSDKTFTGLYKVTVPSKLVVSLLPSLLKTRSCFKI